MFGLIYHYVLLILVIKNKLRKKLIINILIKFDILLYVLLLYVTYFYS